MLVRPKPLTLALSAIALTAALVILQAPAPAARPAQLPGTKSLAPYVPTPQDVVDRMLELAQVTRNDVVYDLGCSDGRIVITAAKKYGARGVGIDLDPERIAESKANAQQAGVANLVEFRLQDIMTVDVSPASVVALYLLTASNLKLRPILTAQLRPGSRIVSHAFAMGDWLPEAEEDFTDAIGIVRHLMVWKTDGKIRR